MGNKTYKDMRVRIDQTANTALVDITSYINSANLNRALNLLDDTALSDADRSVLKGLAGTTITLSGMVNSTTDLAFGPLINAATSVLKTVEYRAYATNSTGNTGIFYYGECLVSNVTYSGSVDTLETFSVDLTFDGAVTRAASQTS